MLGGNPDAVRDKEGMCDYVGHDGLCLYGQDDPDAKGSSVGH